MPDKEPLPLRHPWSFRHLETGEVREYEQRELSIDGEVQLFSLITRSIERLGTDFPWDSLRETLRKADAGQGLEGFDWSTIGTLSSLAVIQVPGLASEAAAVFLGIFPTDTRGQRNPRFDEEVEFLRGALKMERLVEMLKVFAEQNDYKRLALPFWLRARAWLDQTMPRTTGSLLGSGSPEALTSSSPTDTDAPKK
jgi:hypothetical protein